MSIRKIMAAVVAVAAAVGAFADAPTSDARDVNMV